MPASGCVADATARVVADCVVEADRTCSAAVRIRPTMSRLTIATICDSGTGGFLTK
jgi:hypothetical protein